MLSRLSTFLAGEITLHFDLPPHVAAELFLLSGIPCYDQKAGENCYECKIEKEDLPRVEALCRARCFSYTILKKRGAVYRLRALLLRPGLILGALCAVFLVFMSSRYVWDIEIHGNEALTDDEVLSILENHGFSVGVRHTAIDLHLLCNAIPMTEEKIAWISINMQGAIAEVELVEMRTKPDDAAKNENPVNLVAGAAGRIVRFEVSTGRPVVSVGQTVEPGQMLVAGYSEKDAGLFPRASAGRVYAETLIEKSVTVPLYETKKVEREPVLIEKSINILGKTIFFYKKGLQSGEKYDIIEDEYRPDVLSVALPLRVKCVYALPYVEERVALTAEEAKERAEKQLLGELRAECREVLETQFVFEEKEEGLLAVLRAYGIVDIAKRVEVIEQN